MAEITIDIGNYLTEEEIKEVVRDEVKSKAYNVVNEYFRFNSMSAILSNAAHKEVRKLLDEMYDDDDTHNSLSSDLADKTKEVIDDLGVYEMFYDSGKYNSYSSNEKPYKSHGQVVLDECIDELKCELKDKIKMIIKDNLDADYLICAAVDEFDKVLREQLEKE